MSKPKVIASLQIPIAEGILEIAKYDDGEYLITTPDWRSHQIPAQHASVLEQVFSAKPVQAPPSSRLAMQSNTVTTSQAISRADPPFAASEFRRKVLVNDAGGWRSIMTTECGASSAEYVYAKRSQARSSDPSHQIGEGGRIS